MRTGTGLSTKIEEADHTTTFGEQLACLVIYACGAVCDTPEIALDAAAGANFIYKAAGLFDDIQDQDKPDSLAAMVGNGAAMNTASLMLLLGQDLVNEAVAKIVSEQQNRLEEKDLSRSDFAHNPFQLWHHLSQMLTFGFRCQLLDLQEGQLPLIARLENPDFYLAKNGLKAGFICSFFVELGVILGFGGDHHQIASYRQFGFAFGMAMQLMADLGDFLSTSEFGRRDISHRQLTIPIIYAYQDFVFETEKNRFIELWQNSTAPTSKIIEIIDSKQVTLQVIALIVRYVVEADSHLRVVDPNLEKREHQMMLEMLQSFVQRLRQQFILATNTTNLM